MREFQSDWLELGRSARGARSFELLGTKNGAADGDQKIAE